MGVAGVISELFLVYVARFSLGAESFKMRERDRLIALGSTDV